MYCDRNGRIRKHRNKVAGAGIRRYLDANLFFRFKNYISEEYLGKAKNGFIKSLESMFGKTFCENICRTIRARKELVIWSFVLVLMAAIAVGDVEPVAAEGSVDGGMEAVDVSVDRTIQSISFKKDIQIKDALRFLGAKYQKNIVPSSSVEGIVTVSSLYSVTFEEAMEAILGYGFKYDQDGNFIRVYTAEEYRKIKEDIESLRSKVGDQIPVSTIKEPAFLKVQVMAGGV